MCTLSVKSVMKASTVFCAWQRAAGLLHSIPLFARCLVTKTLLRATTSFWFAIMLPVTKTSSIAHTHPAIAVSRAQQRHHVPHCLLLSQQSHVGADPKHKFCFGCNIDGDHRPRIMCYRKDVAEEVP
jgi:hypothetical protein